MKASTVLGIDAGGTHTDAVLITGHGADLRLAASAKVKTRHDDLPASVREVLAALARRAGKRRSGGPGRRGARDPGARPWRSTPWCRAGPTPVGLALSAGPGLNPARFALGEHVCVAPGGLDHRGVEVSPLQTDGPGPGRRRPGVTRAWPAVAWRGQIFAAQSGP